MWCYDMYAVHLCCGIYAFCLVMLWCICSTFYVLLWHIYMCSASCDIMAHIYSLHLVVMLWHIYHVYAVQLVVMLWCICSAFCCDVMSHIYALHLVVMLWHTYMLSILLWYYDAYVVHFVVMLWHVYMLCILLRCHGLCVQHFVVRLYVNPPDYLPAMAAALDACDCVLCKWSAVIFVS
jgi:hypothetical protein